MIESSMMRECYERLEKHERRNEAEKRRQIRGVNE
jgi:hypothetical protein